MLEEQEGRLTGLDGEVLLDLLALLAAEGRIGQHHIIAVPFLNVGNVLGQGVSLTVSQNCVCRFLPPTARASWQTFRDRFGNQQT